jgi:2-deoxy-D-gluconate 3-dehydrogenase
MAIGLAEAGADIIGVSGSIELEGSGVEKEVKALGRKFKAYQADFSNRESLYAFIKKSKAENAVIDILVNNAGTIMRMPAAEHSDEFWDKVMAINLDAQFIMAREFGRDMIARGSGKIIFTCSLLTFQGGITVPGYAASKAALGSFDQSIGERMGRKRGECKWHCSGYVATDNTEALRNDPVRSKSILDRIPAGRWAQPEDFKGATILLASSAADYIHGTIITVDGGWMGR